MNKYLYELEHTADIGIEAVGSDFIEALEKATERLSLIMVKTKDVKKIPAFTLKFYGFEPTEIKYSFSEIDDSGSPVHEILDLDPTEVIEISEIRNICLEADDKESLVVKWLNEVLFYFDSESFVCKKAKIKKIEEYDGKYKIQGLFFGKYFNPKLDTMLTYVKGVTYHQLSITTNKENVTIKVFFDI